MCHLTHRAICSQINITLQMEANVSISPTCFLSRDQRIAIYTGCSVATVLLSFARAILFYFICVNASRVLHNRMFASVLRAPVLFFDNNPIGKPPFINRGDVVMVTFLKAEC